MTSYINRPKPDIEFLHKLSDQIKGLEFEAGLRVGVIASLQEKINQFEEITGVEARDLPKYGGCLEKFKES